MDILFCQGLAFFAFARNDEGGPSAAGVRH
jgi:hypothetical protein